MTAHTARRRVASLLAAGLVLAVSPGATAQPKPTPEPEPTRSDGEADLYVTTSGPARTPLVGERVDYQFAVGNRGPNPAEGGIFSIYAGESLAFVSASSSDPDHVCKASEYPYPVPMADGSGAPPSSEQDSQGGGSDGARTKGGGQVECSLGSMGPGYSADLTLVFERTKARESYGSASVYAQTPDSLYDDNYVELVLKPDDSNPADVALIKTAPRSVAVGEIFDYVITATNGGPSVARDVVVSDYLPDGLRFVAVEANDPGAACAFDAGGDGSEERPYYQPRSVVCSFASIADGSTGRVTITVERRTPWDIYNNAFASIANYDPNAENDYAYHQLGPDRSNPVDVALTKTAPRSPAVGETFDYELTVANFGPSGAHGVTLVDPLPDGVEYVSVSSREGDDCKVSDGGGPPPPEPQPEPGTDSDGVSPMPYQPRELRCELGTLGSGDSSVVHLTVERTSPWEIYNSAYVTSSNYDENQENDYAFAHTPADPSVTSDLSARVRGPGVAPLVGETFDLRVVARNDGPAGASDAWLTMPLTSELQFVSVSSSDANDSCSYESFPTKGPTPMADGASAPPEGAAPPDRDASVDYAYPNYGWGGVNCSLGTMGSGDETTVTITVQRARARAIWASAGVYGGNYDPNYENNYAELELAPDESNPADVGLTKTAPPDAEVGSQFDYVLTVENHGPQTATAVTLDDPIPFGVDLVSVTPDDSSDVCSYDKGSDDVYPPAARPFYYQPAVHCELGALGASETATVRITVTRTEEWEIWNSAWVSTASYDANYDNDYASTFIKGERPWGYCPDDPPPPEPPPSTEPAVPGCDPNASACGTTGSDDISIDFCPVMTGAGEDKIEATTGSDSAHSMLIDSGGGADTIDLAVQVPEGQKRVVRIRAGAGNDVVNVTSAPGSGAVKVIVFAGGGDDTVLGDTTSAARGLQVVVRGGEGNDRIDAFDSTRSADPASAAGIELFGGRGNDALLGGPGPDELSGAHGLDDLDGGPGDDRLDGGRSRDTCRGGPGTDRQRRC